MSELPLSEVIHASATGPGEVDYDVPFARFVLGATAKLLLIMPSGQVTGMGQTCSPQPTAAQ